MQKSTLRDLVLTFAGLTLMFGSYSLLKYHTKKENEFREKVPARVYEIREEISKTEKYKFQYKNILEIIVNKPEVIENYRNLVRERDFYLSNPEIKRDFDSVEKYSSYVKSEGISTAVGLILLLNGLNSLRKRERN